MKSWPAPAKLNLFLHVLGRRADGYHLLQTVFQFLDFCDTLRFEVTVDPRIRRVADLPGVPEDADLTVRAARLLQQSAGVSRGAIIHLDKRIPAGGGLGGGSSDAATTLLALNELWGAGLSRARLAELALKLGADVPVFIHGHAAWAEGVGEVLTPVDLPEPWYVVLAPPVHVATASVFQDPELTRDTPAITIRDFFAGHGHNDLEPVVRRVYPEVDRALDWLGRYGRARMTGSGACVFLEVEDEAAGVAVLSQAPAPLTGFVARGMNRHPL
jgi:4-diphosphocytidyl-2-C-methyl-D-erythritol kinase